MPRITIPEELFFPVVTQPIYTRQTDAGLETEIRISNKQAVLNAKTNEILGVVNKDYRLVTNEEALAYARECAQVVFRDTTEDEWEIFEVDAPQPATYCCIDIRHKTGELDFNYVMVGTREEVPDVYGPYIRVTNSYNAQRALKFTIGCYRKVCKNGMTVPGDVISFSFAHTRDKIQSKIDFAVNDERVRKMQQGFKDAFDALRLYEFDRKHGRGLVQATLAIRRPRNAKVSKNSHFSASQCDWFQLAGHIDFLYAKYADKLGDNAYATLQTVTDLASHPIKNLCLRKNKHTLQRLAGEWLLDFKRQCQERDFELSDYLRRSLHKHEARVVPGRFPAATE